MTLFNKALRTWALAITTAACAIAPNAAHAAPTLCSDKVNTLSPVLNSGFGFNASNTRYQVSQINSANVAGLQLAYTHVAEGAKEKRSVPAVTRQTVYFSEGRDIVAAERGTGCQYWRFTGDDKSSLLFGKNTIRSSSIYYLPPTLLRPAMVYAGDFYGTVYAVNAQTGALVWKAFMGTDTSRHFITGSFQVHGGKLFVPVATKEVITTVLDIFSACCFSHGMLQAVDPYTGKVQWTYHTSANATYNWDTGTNAPNGMSMWGTPTIDVVNNAVLIGTGQNLSLPATSNSDSVLSIDMSTGKLRWVFQATKDDAWNAACQAPAGFDGHCSRPEGNDFDFGSPPILAALPGGGRAVIAGAKNGVVYSLDPKTGALNWSTRLGVGGNLGGIHWGMAADRNNVYAAVTDVWVKKTERIELGALVDPLGANMGPVEGARPGIYALDLRTGNVVWERHDTHVYQDKTYNTLYSAALSVTNDVLFAGSLNGKVRALRTSTGEELWSYDTNVAVRDVNGAAGKGGTIDSAGPVPADTDLLVNSGYATFGATNAWQAGEGNVLFVFRLH